MSKADSAAWGSDASPLLNKLIGKRAACAVEVPIIGPNEVATLFVTLYAMIGIQAPHSK